MEGMKVDGSRGMENKKLGGFKLKTSTEQNDILIPGLPNEMAILCIAWVPGLYYQNIRTVSHGWQDLIHGKLLSKVREELSMIEESLVLCTSVETMWRCFDSTSKTWMKLPQMPNDDRTARHSHSGSVSFDGKLFVVGGRMLLNSGDCIAPSATVTYFDMRSYRWKRLANLNIARERCMVAIVNNQLYVFGGIVGGREFTTPSAEAYDAVTNTWKLVVNVNIRMTTSDSVGMGGKFYTRGYQLEDDIDVGAVYDAETDKWENMKIGLLRGWGKKITVLNGKLYTISERYIARIDQNWSEQVFSITAYNPNTDVWETVMEIWNEGSFIMPLVVGVKIVSFGGMLCIIATRFQDHEEDYDTFKIFMEILEVTESANETSYSMRFQNDIPLLGDKIRAERFFRGWPATVKRCHVIAL